MILGHGSATHNGARRIRSVKRAALCGNRTPDRSVPGCCPPATSMQATSRANWPRRPRVRRHLTANAAVIPNDAEQWRAGQAISNLRVLPGTAVP